VTCLTLGIMATVQSARLASDRLAFGMKVLIAEHKAPPCASRLYPFDKVLRESDVISLHMPLNEQTRHLISTAEFEQMQPGALLINTARGGLVDETALLEALQAGRIGGAGFDVLEKEPPASGHPLLDLNCPIYPDPSHRLVGRAAMQILADQLIPILRLTRQAHPGTASHNASLIRKRP
jgi:glycerate dehydrogenase